MRKKEISAENQLKNLLRWLKNSYYFEHMEDPAYTFQAGEEVVYGAHQKTVVQEVLYEGKIYVIKSTNEKKGEITDSVNAVFWYEIRPLKKGTTSFAANDDVRLCFFNCGIESLIHRYYSFGVNMDPDYQRGYVWDDTDREMLLDSIFLNADIGKFVFSSREDYEPGAPDYEIIDGKQRLHTLVTFYENRWAYRGAYFNDLSPTDQRRFMQHNIAFADIGRANEKTVMKIFLMLNRGGKQMDKEHIEKVQEMYEKLTSEDSE